MGFEKAINNVELTTTLRVETGLSNLEIAEPRESRRSRVTVDLAAVKRIGAPIAPRGGS